MVGIGRRGEASIYTSVIALPLYIIAYKYNPAFVLEENELSDFVLSKMPTLKGKKFQILF